jgi:outer membrane protein TolC
MLLIWVAPVLAQQSRLSLDDCIDIAMRENVSVLTSEYSYESAANDHLEAWGNALPSVSTWAERRYAKTFGTQYIPDLGIFTTVPGVKSYSTRVELSMTLFDGGGTWFNLKRTGELKSSARHGLTNVKVETAYTVKQSYYTLVSAIMLKSVQEDALERSKKQLEVTETRYELGSASLSEKLKQEVNVANDSLLLLERENDIRNAEFALNLILNRDVGLAIEPTDDLRVVDFSLTLDECLAAAATESPMLKQSRADVSAARAYMRMTQGSWLPSVSARLAWNWSTNYARDWFRFERENGSYYFTIGIGYNLFDAFTKKTDYSRAKLQVRTREELYDEDHNELAQSVRAAYLEIQKSKLQYRTNLLAEKSAEEDLKLQEEKYRLGASSILELLDAQYSLRSARYNKVTALYNLNLAVAEMQRALGRM